MLGGWKSSGFNKKTKADGTVIYSNGFDASYGWENVMRDLFERMIPFISEESTFRIEPDDEGYLLGIRRARPGQPGTSRLREIKTYVGTSA